MNVPLLCVAANSDALLLYVAVLACLGAGEFTLMWEACTYALSVSLLYGMHGKAGK